MLCAAAFFERCIAWTRKIAHDAQNADNARKNTAFPLGYAQMVPGGEIEHYLSLGCNHGRLQN